MEKGAVQDAQSLAILLNAWSILAKRGCETFPPTSRDLGEPQDHFLMLALKKEGFTFFCFGLSVIL